MNHPAEGPSPARRGLSWALLAYPAVQALGFLSKAAFAAFVGTVDFGEAMTAAILVLGAQLCAILGLDEAFVATRHPGRKLWRHLRRIHLLWGAVVAGLTALVALGIGMFDGYEELSMLLLGFAPFVWLVTQEVLPRALLRRERRFYPLFLVSLWQSLALFVTTLVLSATGAGAWAFVGGFYAMGLAAVAASWHLSRPLRDALPDEDPREETARETLRVGLPLCGTGFSNYLSERADSLAVRIGLGAAAVGLYELGLLFARIVVNYCGDLAERFLFPVFAHKEREQALGPAWRGTLRLALLFFLPVHVVMAAVSGPLVRTLFPPRWEDAVAVLPALCLAEGLRTIDLAATTALKAVGRGREVFTLGVFKFVLLVLLLLWTVPQGLVAVALGVLGARALGTLVSLVYARRLLPRSATHEGPFGLGAAALWLVLFVPAAWWLLDGTRLADPVLLLILAALSLATWTLSRLLLDRSALRAELGWLRLRLSGRSEPDGGLA